MSDHQDQAVQAGTLVERRKLREAIARVIDPDAVDWTQPWRARIGFWTDDNGPHRMAAIERDEDDERQQAFRRRVAAFQKADAILALSSPLPAEVGEEEGGILGQSVSGSVLSAPLPVGEAEPSALVERLKTLCFEGANDLDDPYTPTWDCSPENLTIIERNVARFGDAYALAEQIAAALAASEARQRELREALAAMLSAFGDPMTRRALGGHNEKQQAAILQASAALSNTTESQHVG